MSKEEIKLHTIATFQGKEYELEELLNELLKENFKLQNKINKAIEYIDEMCLCSSGYFDYGDDLSPKHIVDILKGVNDD